MTSFGYIVGLYYSVSFYSISFAVRQKDGVESCKFMQYVHFQNYKLTF